MALFESGLGNSTLQGITPVFVNFQRPSSGFVLPRCMGFIHSFLRKLLAVKARSFPIACGRMAGERKREYVHVFPRHSCYVVNLF